jgi:hypothetical protein
MQKPQIGAHFLVPADQHTPKTVPPARRALHHPPPCFETGFLLQCLGLFAPRMAVSGEAKLAQQVPDLIIGIALVQTPPLGSICGGSGPLDGDTLDRLTRQLTVVMLQICTSQFHTGSPNS